MGPERDPLAVVDPRLRVRGVGRLRVADAAVFPAMTTVNPMVTVLLIGERAAQLAAADLSADAEPRRADAWPT
jgi:choline dehydrogenase-like flavoprotein